MFQFSQPNPEQYTQAPPAPVLLSTKQALLTMTFDHTHYTLDCDTSELFVVSMATYNVRC